jgi:UPF0755 protein
MSNRRPVGDSQSRPTAPILRSPAEVLEPTRAPKAPRRRHALMAEPRRLGSLLRVFNGLLTLALLAMIGAGVGGLYVRSEIDAPGPLLQAKVVVIPRGEGSHEIADRLEREGVVADRRMFVAGYLWQKMAATAGKPVQLRAGEYEIKPGASIRQVVDILAEGKTVLYRWTIPEGLTSYQIVERIKTDPNFTGEVTALPPEGSLMPDTYNLQRGMARQGVIDIMQAEQKKFLEKTWSVRQQKLPFKSVEEAVVLASIIERETGKSDERDRVAAVFINRLRQNMRLQSDPTILYGLFGGKVVWSRSISKNEIQQKTSHNTYQIDGLPPTAIDNPGRAAIEAALNPANTKDLYFVADGSGGHVFAETLKDHNANVAKWRQIDRKDAKTKAATTTRAVLRGVPDKETAPATDRESQSVTAPAATTDAPAAASDAATSKVKR